MKTEALIKIIIFSGIFCFISTIFPVAYPPEYYLPPIFPKEKLNVANRVIKRFKYHLIKTIKDEVNIYNLEADKTLTKIIKSKKDPWGKEYWYDIYEWNTNSYSYRILIGSSGPDKKAHTKDDITQKVNWCSY